MSNKEHKVYLYYDCKHEGQLYAVTDKKSLAKQFEESRNMDVFIKKRKELSDGEYRSFIKKANVCAKILNEDMLISKTSVIGVYRAMPITIPLTLNEEVYLSSLYDNPLDIFGRIRENASAIRPKKKYREALETLQYYNIINGLSPTKYDEFEIFCRRFGWTIKKDV